MWNVRTKCMNGAEVDSITVSLNDSIDLKKIADSGQCFRWTEESDGAFRVCAFGKVRYLSQIDERTISIDCNESEYDSIWKNYLDAYTDYDGIIASIDPSDEFLTKAGEFGRGIRILRQDPLETLITFIISQRKNIPAIKSCVEKLCRAAGSFIGEYDGDEIYAFPTLPQLVELSCEKCGRAFCSYHQAGIDSCSLGYRMPYIQETISRLVMNPELMEYLSGLDDDTLYKELLGFKGVGKKVANCTALFGFHRLDFFPIDVWIKRVIDEKYGGTFDDHRYSPYAGVIQQYMFYYGRSGKAV